LLVTAIREALNGNWESTIALPELRRSVVIQSFVVLPAAWPLSARSPSASSFPA
jgi:hypothetical protein